MKEYYYRKQFYVYILASKKYGTLYTGISSNLHLRLYQHQENFSKKSFTRRYNIHILVYYEIHDNPESAITREKQIKSWKRDWKINLIERNNPTWEDLSKTLE